jgi:hypothetical protein
MGFVCAKVGSQSLHSGGNIPGVEEQMLLCRRSGQQLHSLFHGQHNHFSFFK